MPLKIKIISFTFILLSIHAISLKSLANSDKYEARFFGNDNKNIRIALPPFIEVIPREVEEGVFTFSNGNKLVFQTEYTNNEATIRNQKIPTGIFFVSFNRYGTNNVKLLVPGNALHTIVRTNLDPAPDRSAIVLPYDIPAAVAIEIDSHVVNINSAGLVSSFEATDSRPMGSAIQVFSLGASNFVVIPMLSFVDSAQTSRGSVTYYILRANDMRGIKITAGKLDPMVDPRSPFYLTARGVLENNYFPQIHVDLTKFDELPEAFSPTKSSHLGFSQQDGHHNVEPITELQTTEATEESPQKTNTTTNSNNEDYIVTKKNDKLIIKKKLEQILTLPISFKWDSFQKHSFKHKDHEYLVVSVNALSPTQISDGEVYIVRITDLKLIRIDYKNLNPTQTEISTDGIFELRRGHRRIDLDRFDMEARFQTTIPVNATDGDGNVTDPTNNFDETYVNLSQQARATHADAPESLDIESERAIRRAMIKVERGSVAILGLPGTGKTRLSENFIARLAHGLFPEIPRTWDVYQLNAESLSTATSLRGQFEAKIGIITKTAQIRPMFLFVDEIHGLRGQGTHSGSTNDVFQMLKTQLAKGQLRLIGTSTDDEFYSTFASDPALLRRIGTIKKEEPKGEALFKALENWISTNEKPMMTRKHLERVVLLSTEFNAAGAQPDNSVSLLEEIYADLALQGRFQDVPEMSEIDAAAQRLYRMDPAILEVSLINKKLQLAEASILSRIAGQSVARKELLKLARDAFAGTQDPKRPRLRIMFYGPKGTGKTELAKAYFEAMGIPYVIIEMQKFKEGFNPSALLDEVADAIRANPFTGLIFDEIEKAHVNAQEALLEFLNDGTFKVAERTLTNGGDTRTILINGRNSSVIMTTNAGQGLLARTVHRQIGFVTNKDEAKMQEAAIEYASPELVQAVLQFDGISGLILDRMEVLAPFGFLSKSEFMEAVRSHLRRAITEIEQRKSIQISIPDEELYLKLITEHNYRPMMSNREILRIIHSLVRSPITDAILSGTGTPGAHLVLRIKDGKVVARPICDDLLL